jgi:DNA-directed RNA polymerase subunit M/transcription elongation factor TFIIS
MKKQTNRSKTVEHRCPVCGSILTSVQKGKRNVIKSLECRPCGYSEYDSDEDSLENRILDGEFDDEFGILTF